MKYRHYDTFDPTLFRQPDKSCAVMYCWTWNSKLTYEEIDSQLAAFHKAGIRGVYILAMPSNFRPDSMPTDLEPAYLSNGFFNFVGYACRKADEYGMQLWFYDEGGWPSGGACGKTVAENPKAKEPLLNKKDVPLEKGQVYKADRQTYAFINGKRVAAPFTAQEAVVVEEYTVVPNGRYHPCRVDSTNRSVTNTFINNTYETYYSHLRDLFGDTVPLMFCDEPSVMEKIIPDGLFPRFEATYGYDLRNHLPAVYDVSMAVTEEDIQARIDYARLVGQIFCENYCIPLSDWCEKHGIIFGGHLDKDHVLAESISHVYFSPLEALRHFGMPGVDAIWHQIRYPYNGQEPVAEGYRFFPLLASSAARQSGKAFALTESFNIYGDALTHDDLRYVIGFQAIRGINVFNFNSIDYALLVQNGKRNCAGFHPLKPGFFHLEDINRYTRRLCYLMRIGKPVVDTALYAPYADYWATPQEAKDAAKAFCEAGVKLENHQIPFDLIDDEGIRRAEITPVGLRMGDAVYSHIVLPPCRHIPTDVIDKVRPYSGEGRPAIVVKSKDLRVMRRVFDKGELWFLFNEGIDTVKEELTIEGKHLYRLDIATGLVLSASHPQLNLSCGDTAVFLVSDEEYEAISPQTTYAVEVNGFNPVSARRFVREPLAIYQREAALAEIGEESFSGEVVFRALYRLPQPPASDALYRITLTDTSVSAEVRLDGQSVGVVGVTPMEIYISADKIRQDGVIEIVLANTAANEKVYRANQGNPASAINGGYEKIALEFEQHYPPLRLGKVTIEEQRI